MVKKFVLEIVLISSCVVLLAGCNKQNNNDKVIQSSNNREEKENKFDLDLTQMSSEIGLALLYQFVLAPQDYSGQSIRMKGAYYANYNEQTDAHEYHCVVKDTSACCNQGIEFVWNEIGQDNLKNELVDEEEIIVTGILETYQREGDSRVYCRIKNAMIERVE